MIITCFCDHEIEVSNDDIYRLDNRPELYRAILDGSFQNETCPKCGTLLKPEIETRLTDPAEGIDIHFIPEKKRTAFLLGELTSDASSVVIGYAELVEYVKILGEKLDIRGLETIKLFLLQKSGLEDVRILFDHRDGENLVFHILGLKEDEVAVTNIPLALYKKTCQSLEERARSEEFACLYTPPYISINKIQAEKEEV